MQLVYEYRDFDLHLEIDGIDIIVTRNIHAQAELVLLTRPHLRATDLPSNIISTSPIGQIVGINGLSYNQIFSYKSLKIKADSNSLYWANFVITAGNNTEIAIVSSLLHDKWIKFFSRRSAYVVFDNTNQQPFNNVPVGQLRTEQGAPDFKFQSIAHEMVSKIKGQALISFKCDLDDLISTVDMIIGIIESSKMACPVSIVGMDLLDILMRPIRPDILTKPLQDQMLFGKYPFKHMEYIEDGRIRFIPPQQVSNIIGGNILISLTELDVEVGMNVVIGKDFAFEKRFFSINRLGENIITRTSGKQMLELPNVREIVLDNSVLDFKVEKNHVPYKLAESNAPGKRIKLMERSSVSCDTLL